ncbi:NAD+ synthase [Candidatus Poribacteria bacterium]|nr:NAD+ synthase [Candidatus Poribacteria bacterium]
MTEKNPLEINPELVSQILVGFIRDQLHKVDRQKVVVGLSGGIDSAASTYLAVRALGNENVWAINMPYKASSPESAGDADLVIQALNLPSMTIEITDMVDAYFAKFPDITPMRKANRMSRERMAILYDQSVALNALVLGTGNKTETLLGYTTLWGDMACAFNPIGDLYKTQIRQLAKYLGVPQRIIDKPPTADLWPGQTDEGELGFTYAQVDILLYYMVDKCYSFKKLESLGFEMDFIDKVFARVQRNQFKRAMPPVAKVFGLNFSFPRG